MPRKRCVLLLAKDAPVRTSLASVLQSADYLVVSAADYREALDSLAGQSLDLAVVDINGGVAKDWRDLQALITANPCLPIILLTATYVTHPLVLRVQACFQKPLLDLPLFMGKVAELASTPPPGSTPPSSSPGACLSTGAVAL